MNEPLLPLNRFSRRVRAMRAWQGLAVGAFAGSAVSALYALADVLHLTYADSNQLAWPVGIGAILGGLAGALKPIPVEHLAKSIDHRAHLQDRLTTAEERSNEGGMLDDALQSDARQHLSLVVPKEIYPLRLSRWHGGTVALSVATAAIFLLGNTPLFLDANAKRAREEAKAEGKKVERVIKETVESPEAIGKLSEAEKRLADEMRRLQRDLERSRMSKEEGRQKANEIAKKAEEMAKTEAQDALQSLAKAESVRDQMMRDQLQKAGMANVDPALAQMSDAERDVESNRAQKDAESAQSQINALASQMAALQQKLENPKLSPEERKSLEKQMKAMSNQLSASKRELESAKNRLKAITLSKEAKAIFAKMQNHPLFKKLQEMASKLKDQARSGSRSQKPEITQAEFEEMRKELEALAKKLANDKEMTAYLQALIDSLGKCKGQCMGIGIGMGLSLPIPGQGGLYDVMGRDTSVVNKLSKEAAGAGKTTTSMISGSQRETGGEDAYIEIKAPTTVGTRSSIPYVKVLPSYRKKAESALNRQEIPKEYEKRVREYFSSLGKQP